MESESALSSLKICSGAGLLELLAGPTAQRPIVVCASHRQAQALHAAFARAQIGSGAQVWETPEILAFSAWVPALHGRWQAQAADHDAPVLLGDAETRMLWRLCVDASREPLMGADDAAQLAAQAWNLCHEYRLDLPFEAGGFADVERFNQWAIAYRRQLERLGAVDADLFERAALARAQQPGAPLPATLVFAGFDEVTPRLADWLAALAGRGASLQRLVDEGAAQTPRCVSLADDTLELRAAAQWALAQTRADPQRSIGVVIADLGTRHETVQRLFDEVFCPQFDAPDAHSPARPYNLTLGVPLASRGLVQTALRLLQLVSGELDAAARSALLCAQDWGHSEDERLERAALDAQLRREGWRQVDLPTLLRLAPASLQARWQPLAGLMPTRRQTPAEWNEAFTRFLAAAQWPGPRSLDSEEFQTLGRWRETLIEFARLERVLGRIPLSAAVVALRQIAERTLFQPQSDEVRVQVMGMLEAQGLSFDALWVSGLDDERFPVASRPHPFIPHPLQRRRGLPHASAAGELAYARTQLEGWRRRAETLVLSHARGGDGRERAPSALLAPWAETIESLDVDALPQSWREGAAAAQLERIDDAHAPPLREGLVVRGGSRVLGDQARCPFRGYALHRLGTRPLETAAYGLQPYDRGNLVHQVLEQLWSDWREQSALLALDADQRQAQVGAAVDAALDALQHKAPQRLQPVMRGLEAQRLRILVNAWLAVESARPPFRVLALEGRVDGVAASADTVTEFEGLRLRLRPDRVDVDPQGRRIVLDYKTGARQKPPWTDGRPEQPQLLLYALSEPAVAALAFARLTAGDIALQGLAADESFGPGIAAYSSKSESATHDAASWNALHGLWRGELATLAREVRNGWAAVLPKHPRQSCRDCGLHPVCRIREQVSLDEGEEAAT